MAYSTKIVGFAVSYQAVAGKAWQIQCRGYDGKVERAVIDWRHGTGPGDIRPNNDAGINSDPVANPVPGAKVVSRITRVRRSIAR